MKFLFSVCLFCILRFNLVPIYATPLEMVHWWEEIPYNVKLSDLKRYGAPLRLDDGMEKTNAISIHDKNFKVIFSSSSMGGWNQILGIEIRKVDTSSKSKERSFLDTSGIIGIIKFRCGISLSMSPEEIIKILGEPTFMFGKNAKETNVNVSPILIRKHSKNELVYLYSSEKEKTIQVQQHSLFNCDSGSYMEAVSYEINFKHSQAVQISFTRVISDIECQ